MLICLECGKEFDNNFKLSTHIRIIHNTAISAYKDKFNIGKCEICNNKLWDYNKSGLCSKCFDSSEATKNLWKEEEYRNKIISKVSKLRPMKFREEQSIRIKEWYFNNPEQCEIRKHSMIETWKSGKIHNTNKSKTEKEIFNRY